MPSTLRLPRRGPIAAMALVFAAAFSMREARAQDVSTERPDAPPGRPRALTLSPGWSATLAIVGAPDATATFESRLDHEAQRRGAMTIATLDPDEDAASRGRSASARTIFTRALRGLLDDQAESLARQMPGFVNALQWIDDFGFHGAGGAARATIPAGREDLAGAGVGTTAPAAVAPSTPFDATFRMRVDAHPRLELRARAGTLTGVVEVPLLERDVRFGLEQPLGRFGKAALRGGHSAEEGDWADLVVGIRF